MKSLEDLLPQLVKLTDEGKLGWQVVGSGTFTVTVSGNVLKIFHWTNESNGIDGFSLDLRDSANNLLDQVRADEFSQRYPKLDELYDRVRRNALGVAEVVEKLHRELASL